MVTIVDSRVTVDSLTSRTERQLKCKRPMKRRKHLEGSRPFLDFIVLLFFFVDFFLTQIQKVSSIDIVESTEIIQHIITQIFIISGFSAKVSVLLLYYELIRVNRFSAFGPLPFF
jgi:hypothetical protein